MQGAECALAGAISKRGAVWRASRSELERCCSGQQRLETLVDLGRVSILNSAAPTWTTTEAKNQRFSRRQGRRQILHGRRGC
jgi:hypothetical protein